MLKRLGLVGLLSLVLAGCVATQHDFNIWPLNAYPLAVQEKIRQNFQQLQGYRSLQLQLEGQQLRIYFPANLLFAPSSSHLQSHRDSLIRNLAHMLNLLHPVSAEVIGYSVGGCNEDFDQSLSEQQAAEVVRGLVEQGARVRVLAAHGKGRNSLDGMKVSPQQRIEIHVWLNLDEHLQPEG